jgi:hypothetical protein
VGPSQSEAEFPEKDRGKCGEFTQERGPAPISTEEACNLGAINFCVMVPPAADMTSFILCEKAAIPYCDQLQDRLKMQHVLCGNVGGVGRNPPWFWEFCKRHNVLGNS